MLTKIYNLKDLLVLDTLEEVLRKDMNFETDYCDLDGLLLLFESLREDLMVGMESGYVDAMYRDEYYHYFATKLHSYGRNCVKITFFEPDLLESGKSIDYCKLKERLEKDKFKKVIQNYTEYDKPEFLGFVILRPVLETIGRNVIAIQARKPEYQNVLTCKTWFSLTALGFSVDVSGFPHCSQDREMMTCAETALWAITEYYGHKYSKYKSILPSDILTAMKTYSPERQLPSVGLSFGQISIGLSSFGFTPLSYLLWKDNAINEDIKEIFSCYVESGFPLALWLEEVKETSPEGNENNDESTDSSEEFIEDILISHAAICIGRDNKNRSGIIQSQTIYGEEYYVWNRSIDTFVIWDDSMPCFQKGTIDQPTLNYKNKRLKNLRISSFIVPLPSKVYLDAYQAIEASKSFMALLSPNNTVIRTFLLSSREFRNHLATSLLLTNNNKEFLLTLELPRFVWVSELSSIEQFGEDKVTGIILIDATEASIKDSIQNIAPLILFINNGELGPSYAYNADKQTFGRIKLKDKFVLETYSNTLFFN